MKLAALQISPDFSFLVSAFAPASFSWY